MSEDINSAPSEVTPSKKMNALTWSGIGCGCFPSVLLIIVAILLIIAVAAGIVNYSEEETVSVIAGIVLFLALVPFGIVGVALVLFGIFKK